MSPTDAARKKAKQKKTMVMAGGALGAGAAVGGCFLNPMMVQSAIDALPRLANMVFSGEMDPLLTTRGRKMMRRMLMRLGVEC